MTEIFGKRSDEVEKMPKINIYFMYFCYICTMNVEFSSPGHYLFLQISDLIKERGTMIVDYSSSQLIDNEEYISPYSVVALCHRGYVKSEYDLRPVEFHAHDISVMRPGHIIRNIAASADYSAQLIVTHTSSLNGMRQQYISHHLAAHKLFDTNPCQHLTDKQYRQVCDAFNLIQTACSIEGIYRDELISSTFHTLMVLLSSFRYEQIESQQDVGHQLSQQFNDAVIEHYRQSHEVSFYASMFHLSPKYFSTLIKQETGISAGEWIDRYVTLQAKELMNRCRNHTIQQISDDLGFCEQASFSRFFKKQTGMTPTEYKKFIMHSEG